jgi:hypothetical protein
MQTAGQRHRLLAVKRLHPDVEALVAWRIRYLQERRR